jgi:chemotaxis protein methyltransferase CheR
MKRQAHPPASASALALAVEHRFGVRLRPELQGLLERAADELVASGAATSAPDVARRLERASDQDPLVGRMLQAASVRETWFFRGHAQLDALVKRLGSRPQVRVWSAACATGEEAYSAAALFRRALPHARVHVLGTDMNGAALEVARVGRYGRRSFREVGVEALNDVVAARGEGFEVRDEVRRCVELRRFNLVTDPVAPQPPFDVVLCRNVLIYFRPETLPPVMAKLARSVAPGGVLALTPAEHGAGALLSGFRSLGRALFVREERPARPPAPLKPDPPAPHASVAPPPARSSHPKPDVLELARHAADHSRYDEALVLLERARADDAARPEVYLLWSSVLLALGDAKHAATLARRALFLERDLAAAELALAQALVRAGQGTKAQPHFKRALKLLEPLADGAAVKGLTDTARAVRAFCTTALEGAR